MRLHPQFNIALVVMMTVTLYGCSDHKTTRDSALNIASLIPTTLSQQTQQMIIVTTDTWSNNTGQLSRFIWQENQWKPLPTLFPVMIGRNGLAWGQGLHKNPIDAAQKKEGDGKATAGLFTLGTAFGYAEKPLKNMKMPYRAITTRDYYIDDVESADYNQWQHIKAPQANTPKQRWRSFEKMKRDDQQYEYGLVIQHNTHPVIKHKGSAIFFHVWKSSTTATSGCTAMSKQNMQNLLQWIEPKLNPILIQIPMPELETFLQNMDIHHR